MVMKRPMVAFLTQLLFAFCSPLTRRARLEAENLILRQQLVVLRRKSPTRVRLWNIDRLLLVWLYRLYPSLLDAIIIVQPETVIRWHRDGSGKAAFPADLLIEGGRIRAVARNRGQLDGAGAEVIEAGGMTLMPGLVEGHAHLSFGNAVATTDLGDLPSEEHTLLTARNAKTLLDHGFTSAYSAASAKLRLNIVIRNAIAAGQIPGPRLKACGPEITVTGGLGDERSAHMYRESFAVIADGPAEIVKWARLCCREGADSIKLNVSGDNLYRRRSSRP